MTGRRAADVARDLVITLEALSGAKRGPDHEHDWREVSRSAEKILEACRCGATRTVRLR